VEPTYRLPLYRLMQAAWYMARDKPRNLGEDFRFLLHTLPAAPDIEGSENLPRNGAYVLVANHYERPGLWMGWTGMALARSVWEHGGRRLRIIAIAHWTDYRIGPIPIPSAVTRVLFRRFFRVFGFIAMEPASAGPRGRAEGVRRTLHALADGDPVVLFPEGDIGETPAMIPAQPGTGSFLLAMVARGAPLIPTAIYESCGRLTIRFGAPLDAVPSTKGNREERDRFASVLIMRSVAGMLPPALRGAYADSGTVPDDASATLY